MARPPTPDVRITEALQPAAAVVNVGFSHPAAPAPSALHGVAQALGSLSSDLMAWGQKEEAKRKEEDAIRGEAAFYQENGDGIAEGIRTDQIPADRSPEFVKGYKRAMGAAGGLTMSNVIESEYAKSDIKTNSDPRAFDAWLRGQIKQHVTSDDPSVLRGLNPQITHLYATLHNRWQSDVDANTKYTALSGYGALAGTTIDEHNRNGLLNHTGTDIDTLGATLDTIRDKGFALGLKRDAIDKVMVDAITTKALEHRDPSLLKLLDRDSAAGPKLAATPYGRDERDKAVKALTSLFKQETIEDRQKQDREDKAAATSARSKIADILIKDPNADPPEDLVNTVITRGKDGDFKINLMTWRENVRKGMTAEDPKQVQEVMTDLLAGKGEDAFWAAVRGGVIKSPETMARARSFMDTAAKANAATSKVLETAAARSYTKNIEKLGEDNRFEATITGVQALTEGGRKALNDYRLGLMQWQITNPGASPLEQEKFATEYGEQIIKGLSAGEQGQYTQQPDVSKRLSPPAPQAPAPIPEQLQFLNTPENRQKVDDFARRNNLTTEQALGQLQRSWQKMHPQAQPTGPMPPVQPMDDASKPPVPEVAPSSISDDIGTLVRGAGEYIRRSIPPTMLPPSARPEAPAPAPGTVTPPVQPMDDATSPPTPERRSSADSPVRLASLGDQPTMPMIDGKPVKSHLDLAKSLLGKNEQDDQKALVAFFKSSMGSSINPAITPWCARFANAVLAASGQKGTGSDMARSFLNYGSKIEPAKAKPGDIIVFPRGSSKIYGHVGFVQSVDVKTGTVKVLGGNQGGAAQKGGAVTVQTFPLDRALGVRRVTQQAVAALMADSNSAFA